MRATGTVRGLNYVAFTGAGAKWSGGPWVESTAAFRAFSEYWLVTMILVAATGLRMRRWLAVPALAFWGLCIAIAV